jgi:hypothetical protein
MRLTALELVGTGLITVMATLYTGDALIGASVVVLWLIWKLTMTDDGLFVVPLALTFQWMQSTLGLFYLDFFGRSVDAIDRSDYRPMVMIGLGCCLALAIGVFLGTRLLKPPSLLSHRPEFAFSFKLVLVAYVVTIILEGGLNTVVHDFPSLRQIAVNFDQGRLAILYLLLRRFYSPVPRWGLIAAVVGFEVTLGITGFFAGFREPLVLAGLGMLEVFDRRNAQHWVAAALVGTAAVGFGLVWMGIRTEYRRDYVQMDNFRTDRRARISRIGDLASGFLQSDASGLLTTVDNLVDRMWPVYYPALAVSRVPGTLPHTNGAILASALQHITMPRIFFPEKAGLMSDSEMVRKYSGVMVAGAETGTSIAFGYAGESYIDYGLPWMFLPVFAFGLLMGLAYRFVAKTIRHRELLVAYSTVTFWFALYLFERSWVMTLGETVGLLVYVGAPVILLDRLLLDRQHRQSGDQSLLFPQSDGVSF